MSDDVRPMNQLPEDVRAYAAREVVRRYRSVEANFAEKLRRNVRRNFKVTLSFPEIDRLLRHYTEVYRLSARLFPEFLYPPPVPLPPDKYASEDDVDMKGFMKRLEREYPDEPLKVIDLVAYYTLFYEHLK